MEKLGARKFTVFFTIIPQFNHIYCVWKGVNTKIKSKLCQLE